MTLCDPSKALLLFLALPKKNESLSCMHIHKHTPVSEFVTLQSSAIDT